MPVHRTYSSSSSRQKSKVPSKNSSAVEIDFELNLDESAQEPQSSQMRETRFNRSGIHSISTVGTQRTTSAPHVQVTVNKPLELTSSPVVLVFKSASDAWWGGSLCLISHVHPLPLSSRPGHTF